MNRTLARGAVAAALLSLSLVAPLPALDPGRFDIHGRPVETVNDTMRIATPEVQNWNRNRAYVDDQWLRPMDHLLALRGAGRAMDLNCSDEVPASTWFAPRPDPPASVRPDHAAPLQVLAARLDGTDPFLVVRDARGDRYWLDFDAPGAPELRTTAAVVSARLLHAAGFSVLDCGIDALAPGELTLAPDASRTGEFWGQDALEEPDLQRFLARLAAPEGKIRVAANRMPPGIALGSFRERGVRGDDPNDRIPHQDRRSLRGLRILASWLDYPAFREDRTLDVYLLPQGYVRHYIRGLARTLGADPRDPAQTAPVGFSALTDAGFEPRSWAPLRSLRAVPGAAVERRGLGRPPSARRHAGPDPGRDRGRAHERCGPGGVPGRRIDRASRADRASLAGRVQWRRAIRGAGSGAGTLDAGVRGQRRPRRAAAGRTSPSP